VITAEQLRTETVKKLASMAKQEGVVGWHQMRKEQLIKSLIKISGEKSARGNGIAQISSSHRASNGRFKSVHKPAVTRNRARVEQLRAKLIQTKNLAHSTVVNNNIPEKDRVVLMVQDSFWLNAYWELTPQSIERAEVALGKNWHTARPVLRLSSIGDGTNSSIDRVTVRDIKIHGNVNHWYLDVEDNPQSYQVDVGYLTEDGHFHSLARSNVVSTAISKQPIGNVDQHWSSVASHYDRIFALSGGYSEDHANSELKAIFEEKLRRPMGSPMVTRFGLGADSMHRRDADFTLEVDSEMILYGATDPGSHVTVKGEPIAIEEDGTFTMRFVLPDRRQVIPIVSSSGDGVEQRTVIVAVERNTKVLEPLTRESEE
jgi:uncharacterized protein